MAKASATKTEQTTVHPDIALIAGYHAAQEASKAYQARLQAVTASLMAQQSQPSPEALDAAKARINAFLEREYPNKSARRGVATDIDLDGYKYGQESIGDVAPEFLEIAQADLAGKILVDGTEALYRSIVDYVCSARDEDGSPVLLGYQQQAVNHLFFPPATPSRAPRVAKEKKEKTEGAVSGTSSIGVKVCKWPGTDISAKVSEFGDGTIRVQGRAKANLMDALSKQGINVSKEAIDKTMAEVYKAS